MKNNGDLFADAGLLPSVDKNIPDIDVVKMIKVSGKGLVKEVLIFDEYEGANIADDKKSLAMNIALASDHTLNDKEIVDVMDKIKFELNKKFGIQLRM